MRDWESMMADVGWWWNGRRVDRCDSTTTSFTEALSPTSLWIELAGSEESGSGHMSW
jgi:hypothetical protein